MNGEIVTEAAQFPEKEYIQYMGISLRCSWVNYVSPDEK